MSQPCTCKCCEQLVEALRGISLQAHCIAKAGPMSTPTLQDAWGKFMRLDAMATQAIYDHNHHEEAAVPDRAP